MVRALERWLHRPGGATNEEVTALLQPSNWNMLVL